MFAFYILDYTEQFIQNSFLTCSWRNFISNELEELQLKIGKKYWDLEPCRKNTKNDCKLPMIANIVKIYCLENSYKVST